MDKLSSAIVKERLLHEKIFALINTGTKTSNGEHWMGTIINRRSNALGYFDSFGRNFPWLINTIKEHSKTVHQTRHNIQAEPVSTCGLHSLYFIIRMMDPLNKASYMTNVYVGEYVCAHHDMKEGDTILMNNNIVHHLSKTFKMNLSMLLHK